MSDRPKESADAGADEFEPGSGDDEIEEADDVEDADDAEGDAESDADDSEEDVGADDDGEEKPRAQRPVERRESRYQRAIRESRESKAETARLRQEFEQARRQAPPPDPAIAQRQEREFLESLRLMDPVDAAIAVRDRERQYFGQALQQLQGQSLDRADKAEFAAEARSDPAMARMRDQVEAAVAQARAMGNFAITRRDIFYRMYGEEMANKRSSAPRQKATAQRRVAAQTTRPASGRGEAARAARPAANSAEADEALLSDGKRRGVPLW